LTAINTTGQLYPVEPIMPGEEGLIGEREETGEPEERERETISEGGIN